MKNVIDIRDMHTGIHSLYLVNSKPKACINAFDALTELGNDDQFLNRFYWNFLEENITCLGEINYRNISGGQVTRRGIPKDDCIYNDGNVKYRVIARFDLWY